MNLLTARTASLPTQRNLLLPLAASSSHASLTQTRSVSFRSRNRQLDRAVADAESYPHDPGRQARAFQLLNENEEFLKVISRFENNSGRAVFDEACIREYVKALVFSGRFDNFSLIRLVKDYTGIGSQQGRQNVFVFVYYERKSILGKGQCSKTGSSHRFTKRC